MNGCGLVFQNPISYAFVWSHMYVHKIFSEVIAKYVVYVSLCKIWKLKSFQFILSRYLVKIFNE